MILGAILFLLMPLTYAQTLSTPMFLWVRMLHGFGFGCFMTAASAYITLEVPASRRAEGLSHYSNAIKLAMAGGPYLGLYLASQGSFDLLFYLASGIGLISLLLTLPLGSAQFLQRRETNPKEPIQWNKLIQKAAIFPGLVMTSNSVVFGTLIPFTPIFAKEKGFIQGEVDLFYVIYAFSLIFSRALTGPISDKFGRSQVIIPGMMGVSITLGLLAVASEPSFFLAAAALYGLCAGTVQPSLMAMVADRVPDKERGAGMATFTLLNDLGIALGTFLCGHFGPEWGYLNTLNIIIGITILGILGFITFGKYFDKLKIAGATAHVS
jgi:MFS family permease